jgi:hypothetical protein
MTFLGHQKVDDEGESSPFMFQQERTLETSFLKSDERQCYCTSKGERRDFSRIRPRKRQPMFSYMIQLSISLQLTPVIRPCLIPKTSSIDNVYTHLPLALLILVKDVFGRHSRSLRVNTLSGVPVQSVLSQVVMSILHPSVRKDPALAISWRQTVSIPKLPVSPKPSTTPQELSV